jgi:uncharacterized membrane protein YeaQ/YmgE (transglycosylase-associated protein family)
LLVIILIGGLAGLVVGACFRGRANRGAIAFAVLYSLWHAVGNAMGAAPNEGTNEAIADFLAGATGGLVAGALLGRLIGALVKRVKRALFGRSQIAYVSAAGMAAGAIGSVVVVVALRGSVQLQASPDALWLQLTPTSNLFGILFWIIAGALAGALTPRIPASEFVPATLVQVWEVDGSPEAEVVKSLLASEGIESVASGDALQRVVAQDEDRIRMLRILVPEGAAERAREIIEEGILIEAPEETTEDADNDEGLNSRSDPDDDY